MINPTKERENSDVAGESWRGSKEPFFMPFEF